MAIDLSEKTRVELSGYTIAYYNAARTEVLQRIQMMEQWLIGYLTACGIIATIGFSTNLYERKETILLLIPLMSLPIAYALLRHDSIIRGVDEYVKVELTRFLPESAPMGAPVHWDSSVAQQNLLRGYLVRERILIALLLTSPGAVVLWHYVHTGKPDNLQYAAASCSVAITLLLLLFRTMTVWYDPRWIRSVRDRRSGQRVQEMDGGEEPTDSPKNTGEVSRVRSAVGYEGGAYQDVSQNDDENTRAVVAKGSLEDRREKQQVLQPNSDVVGDVPPSGAA